MLVSCEDFYPIGGGGETWLEEALAELGTDNEVQIHYVGRIHPKAKNYTCHPKSPLFALKFPIFKRTLIRHYFANMRWKRHLRDVVRQFKPDVILTQLMYTPASVDIANEFKIPVITYLHNYEHFDPYLFKSSDPYTQISQRKSSWPLSVKLQWPWVNLLLRWHERALRKAELIISNSQSMADILKFHYKLKSKVLFPIGNLELYKTKPGKAITFINPIKAKGVEVFLEVAKLLPNQKFVVFGGVFPEYIPKVKALKNVKHYGWESDKRKIYSTTRLLIAPSQWAEPFGRVPLEAGISGIPSIVSRRGGLPESAGKGSIVIDDYKNPEAWVKAIKKFDNKSFYSKMSKAAKLNANNYTRKKQDKRLRALINLALKDRV